MEIAARRAMRKGLVLSPPAGLYDEFVARFPYDETDDQARAIDAVIDDLGSGHPMDRLVCGDVGFGKTEVALRAAFVVAMAGRQVAILAPTTLLVRQHFQVMRERFAGLPLRIEQVSRFVPPKQIAQIRAGLEAGEIDIVVGTHALLGDKVTFRDLALVVIDEEQHFGVVHKERLKQLRAEIHVLTMTATPIPRTLQMALGGLEGAQHHRHAAGRPTRRARLRPARRPRGTARGDPARALPRRPDLLRLPADRGPGQADRAAAPAGARGQDRDRQWPHAGQAARGRDGGVLRPQASTCWSRPTSSNPGSTSRPPTP